MKDFHYPIWQDLHLQLLCGERKVYGQKWGGDVAFADDFCRLYLPNAGVAEVENKLGKWELQSDHIYLFPDSLVTRYQCHDFLDLSWVHFNIQWLPGLSLFSRTCPIGSVTCKEPEKILFDEMLNHMQSSSPAKLCLAHACLLKLLAPFMPQEKDELIPAGRERRRLLPILNRIRAEPHKEFDLKSLAREVHVHPTYLSNLFRKVVGTTPLQFRIHCQIEQARSMLMEEEHGVQEIAERCGFADAFYFSRLFKRKVGIAPSQYRDKVLSHDRT